MQPAYIAVMQTVTATNKSGYDSLLRVYKETDLSQEKVRILGMPKLLPLHLLIRLAYKFRNLIMH